MDPDLWGLVQREIYAALDALEAAGYTPDAARAAAVRISAAIWEDDEECCDCEEEED